MAKIPTKLGDLTGTQRYEAYDLVGAMRTVGFPPSAMVTMLAICGAESGWDSKAINKDSDGSVDAGAFQINSVHGIPVEQLTNGNVTSAGEALKLYNSKGGKFTDWATYKSGAWRAWVPISVAVVVDSGYGTNVVKPLAPDPAGNGGGILGGIGKAIVQGGEAASPVINGALSMVEVAQKALAVLVKAALWVGNSHNWVRILEVIGGAGVLLYGLNLLASSGAGPVAGALQGAKNTAQKAGKAAAVAAAA